jgi:hypothetical protein
MPYQEGDYDPTVPPRYIETDTDLMREKVNEWIGRCYAADEGRDYPVPPDTDPENAPPEAFTWFFTQAEKKPNGTGGVHILLKGIERFSTSPKTLSDGEEFSFDIANDAKEYSALSAAGKAVLPP